MSTQQNAQIQSALHKSKVVQDSTKEVFRLRNGLQALYYSRRGFESIADQYAGLNPPVDAALAAAVQAAIVTHNDRIIKTTIQIEQHFANGGPATISGVTDNAPGPALRTTNMPAGQTYGVIQVNTPKGPFPVTPAMVNWDQGLVANLATINNDLTPPAPHTYTAAELAIVA